MCNDFYNIISSSLEPLNLFRSLVSHINFVLLQLVTMSTRIRLELTNMITAITTTLGTSIDKYVPFLYIICSLKLYVLSKLITRSQN